MTTMTTLSTGIAGTASAFGAAPTLPALPLVYLNGALEALYRGNPRECNDRIRNLPLGIASRIFFLAWERGGQPSDRGPNFGRDAFFGQNNQSLGARTKILILEQVVREQDPSCAFCQAATIARQCVYSDGTHWDVLVSASAVAKGHFHVIPKRHAETFDRLLPEEGATLPAVMRRCTEAYERLFGKKMDYMVIQKNGGHAGQSVRHVHYHLLPADTYDTIQESIPKMLFQKNAFMPWLLMAKQVALSKLSFAEAHPDLIRTLERDCAHLTVEPSLHNLAAKWRLQMLPEALMRPQDKEIVAELMHKISFWFPTEDNFYATLENVEKSLEPTKVPSTAPRDRNKLTTPYAFNQIQLASGILMNASRIKFPEDGQSYASAPTSFIAVSAPMPGYILNTLQMYMELNIQGIVNLTAFEEGLNIKAHRYLPQEEGEVIEGSGYSMKNIKVCRTQLSSCWTLEEKEVEVTIRDKIHRFTQFHIQEWNDCTPGDLEGILQLSARIVAHRREIRDQGPIAVHCSSGVGRTGVFIGASVIHQKYAAGVHPDQINVRAIAGQMRIQRWYLGGTREQYEMLWKIKRCLAAQR